MNYRSQCICFWSIGHSSRIDADRRIGQGLRVKGWERWVEERVDPKFNQGFRRFELHNPFGVESGEVMDFDQAAEAMSRPEWDWITADFVEAWKPVTLLPDTEVIAYLGSLKSDKDMVLLEKGSDTVLPDPASYIARLTESLRHVLSAGCSVAFDHIGGQKGVAPNHPAVAVMDLLESLGVKTYYEPWPHKNAAHMHCRDVWTNERYYQSQKGRWDDPDEDSAKRSQIKGNIIRHVREAESGMSYTETCQRVLDEGDSCSFKAHIIEPTKLAEWLA